MFILLSLGLISQNSFALKPETLLELMGSNKNNPSLSKLYLPSGEKLLDRKKPNLKNRVRKEHPSLVIYVVRHGALTEL